MSVEFLPGEPPVDAPDESLVTPQRSPRTGGWLVLAALLTAGVTAWALTRPPSPRGPVVAPTSTLSRSTDPECRGIPRCAVRASVPLAVARLVRAYLPPGVHLRVRTVIALGSPGKQDEFVTREIDAFVDSVSVLIRIQRGGSVIQTIAPDPPGVGSLLLHHVTSGFVVRLQYLAPETVPPKLGPLRALIRDPRLTA